MAHFIVLFALIAVCAMASADNHLESPHHELKILPCPHGKKGPVAHPHNCALWINCEHGSGPVQRCAPGTLFNPVLCACDHPQNVHCGVRHDALGLISIGDHHERPHPKPEIRNDAHYDALGLISAGDHHERPHPKPEIRSCPHGLSGPVAHPHDCSLFINCKNGSGIVQRCAHGTLFNPKLRVCDHAKNVHCGVHHDAHHHGN